MEDDHTAPNVQYVLGKLLGTRPKARKDIATDLRINTSTISRWMSGGRPQSDLVRRLAQHTGIAFEDFGTLSASLFKTKWAEVAWSSSNLSSVNQNRSIDFKCILRSEDFLRQCLARHFGSYLMFTQQRGDSPLKRITAHLLNIHNFSTNGIEFEIFRRFDDDDERKIFKQAVWNHYAGLMFDIEGFLYFFGEDEIKRDMMTMITDRLTSRLPNELMVGHMVSVKKGANSGPMTWKVALLYKSKSIINPDDVRDILRQYSSTLQIPHSIRPYLAQVFGD